MSEGVIREARVKFRTPRTILVVVKLDPESPHDCMTALPDDGDPLEADMAYEMRKAAKKATGGIVRRAIALSKRKAKK